MPPRLQFSEQHQLRWREEIFDESGQGSFLINVIVTFERLGKTRLLCLFTITLDTVTLFIVRSARSNHSSIMEVRKLYIFCKTTGWKGIKMCTIRCRRIIETLHRHIQLGIFTLMCWQLWNFILWQMIFNWLLYPNELPQRIFWYLVRQLDWRQ